MILAWLFWLLLLAPGAWLHRRLRGDESVSAFETIALGYALSFLLLTPLCVAGYVLTWPLWTFSAGSALLAVGGAALWVRDLHRAGWKPSLRGEHRVSLVLIALFLLQAAAVGGHVVNDADFHLARIRFLYDVGLSNADPMTGTGFSHPYHTNILHALVAACARLTGLDPIVAWQGALPWAKLVAASGITTLCLRLGGSALGAFAACIAYLGAMFLNDWVLYPNQLAPAWLVPIGLSGCIGLFTSERVRYQALLIGGASALLGLVHGLYAGFFGLVASAAIAALSVQRVIARKGELLTALRLALLGGLLLTTSAPALYVARYAYKPAQANFDYQGGQPTPRKVKKERYTSALRTDERGRFHVPLENMFGGPPEQVLAVAALAGLLARRRYVEALGGGVALGSCLVLLHVPAVAQLAVETLSAAWMVERVTDVVACLHFAFVCAGLFSEVSSARLRAYLYALVPPVIALATVFNGAHGLDEVGKSRMENSFRNIKRWQVFGRELPKSIALDQALVRKIPSGSVVLTHPLAARQLRKLHHIRFVRASRNHTGVDDLVDRTVAMHKLQYAKGPTKDVKAVLRKYGIRYAIQKADHPIRWLRKQKVIGQTATLQLIEL